MNIFDIISFLGCMFYTMIGISFAALCCLTFCGPYDYKDEDNNETNNLNIMSDTYQGNNRIYTRSYRRRANSK